MVRQNKLERSFHIFYQMIKSATPEMKGKSHYKEFSVFRNLFIVSKLHYEQSRGTVFIQVHLSF